jgi:prepilin-type N-terminal cleavage/methylation domain-containing protein
MGIKSMRAFSLIELSIVLVILGLLTGGILAGKSLIHASELRKTSTDYQRYRTAIYAFRDKYFALPGDMTNATSVWGTAGGNGTGLDNNCYNAPTTTTATCNGNGDGKVTVQEHYMAWKQMANAGLVEGSFTGTPNGNDITYTGYYTTANTPAGINNTFWGFVNLGSQLGNGSFYDGTYDNVLQLGGYYAPTTSNGTAKIIPEDMWNIDMKMDDGKPASGKVRARVWGALASGPPGVLCAPSSATNTTLNADYDLVSTSAYCVGLFLF